MPTAAVYGCRNACSLNKHELVSPSVSVLIGYSAMDVHLAESYVHSTWTIVGQGYNRAVRQLSHCRDSIRNSVRSCSLEEDFFRKRPLLRLTACR